MRNDYMVSLCSNLGLMQRYVLCTAPAPASGAAFYQHAHLMQRTYVEAVHIAGGAPIGAASTVEVSH